MTARQEQVLMLVISGVTRWRCLANALGVESTHTVACHLTALRRKHGTLVATVPEVS